MVALLEKAALPFVEGNCAFLAFLDLLFFDLEHFDKVSINFLTYWNSIPENIKFVSFLQFSRSHFYPCNRNGLFLTFLDCVDFHDLGESSLDTFDAVSFSFQCDFLDFFQESMNKIMSFGSNTIFKDNAIGLRSDSDSKSDDFCVGKFGIFYVTRSGVPDVSIQDVNVNLIVSLYFLSHGFQLFKNGLFNASVTELED